MARVLSLQVTQRVVKVRLHLFKTGVFVATGPVKIHDTIRFGEDFELNLQTYKLSRSGRVLRLERIPTEILLFLIEQRGQLATREQIVEKVWGKGVFLDTDNSINGAIRKIRQVLNDDAEQPHFIQTITGRGYRFIASVAEVDREAADARPAITQRQSAEGLQGARPSSQAAREAPNLRSSRRALSLVFLMIAFAAGAFLWYWQAHWRRTAGAQGGMASIAATSKLTNRDTVVLSDFVNKTGDPIFDETLNQALSMELTQSPFLSVASDLQIAEILRRMGRSRRDVLSREVAAEPADTFFRIHGTSSRNLLCQYANICVNETKIHFTGLLANAGSGVEDVVVSSK